MNTLVIDRVVEQLKALPYELQWRVLEFTHALAISVPHGVPGRQLLRFAGVIPLDDLQLMRQAIEQGCEGVSFCHAQGQWVCRDQSEGCR